MLSANTVTAADWLSLAAGVAGLLVGFIQSRDRLPGWARKWLARIGRDQVESAVAYAARLAAASPEERRAQAVAYLTRLAKKDLGLELPESIGNLLVEFVYQQWKRQRAKAR